jgi:lipid-binding SYLF domain-containing protein
LEGAWLREVIIYFWHEYYSSEMSIHNQVQNFEVMQVRKLITAVSMVLGLFLSVNSIAQTSTKDKKVVQDANEAKADFIQTDGLMQSLFNNAYGYVIFPNVGKGAMGVGGAAGNGAVYEQGNLIGMAKMTQVTIGFQLGGQAYREVIFFETKADLDRFRQDKLEFSAQASAVAATAGAAANAKYKNGVMIFSQIKGGLMYEASVGGQKFKFRKL